VSGVLRVIPDNDTMTLSVPFPEPHILETRA
jgi:hypothetical protein